MRIDIASSDGNIMVALGIARKLLKRTGHDQADIDKLTKEVWDAGSYDAACKAITEATGIEFYDSNDE